MTVYDYDLHDLAQGAFQSIQERALFEQQSLRDVTPVAAVAPIVQANQPQGGLLRKVVVGAAMVGVVGGAIYIGSRVLSGGKG